MGETGFVPQTWEGWIVLVGGIAAIWAVSILHDQQAWAQFGKWFVDVLLGRVQPASHYEVHGAG